MSGIWFGWSVAVFPSPGSAHAAVGDDDPRGQLNYPVGSTSTITRDLLGQGWNVVNGLSIAFVLYILTYAYISGGGSIIGPTLSSGLGGLPAGKARRAAVRPGGGAGGVVGAPARWTVSPR